MDAEQIQQQMRARRAAIDAKLDRLRDASRAAGRRSAGAFLVAASLTMLAMLVVRQAARRRRRRPRPAEVLRLAKSG